MIPLIPGQSVSQSVSESVGRDGVRVRGCNTARLCTFVKVGSACGSSSSSASGLTSWSKRRRLRQREGATESKAVHSWVFQTVVPTANFLSPSSSYKMKKTTPDRAPGTTTDRETRHDGSSRPAGRADEDKKYGGTKND